MGTLAIACSGGRLGVCPGDRGRLGQDEVNGQCCAAPSNAGQDGAFAGIAATLHARLDVGIDLAHLLLAALDGKDHLGSEPPACMIAGWPCGLRGIDSGPRVLIQRPW